MHLNFMVIDGIIYVANRSILIVSKVNQITAHLKMKYKQSEIKVTLDKTDVHWSTAYHLLTRRNISAIINREESDRFRMQLDIGMTMTEANTDLRNKNYWISERLSICNTQKMFCFFLSVDAGIMSTRAARHEESYSSSNVVRTLHPSRPLSPPQKHVEYNNNNLGELPFVLISFVS